MASHLDTGINDGGQAGIGNSSSSKDGKIVPALSHSALCERARRWLTGTARCPIALVEFVALLPEIPDAIGFRESGRDSVLIECKTSRSDFIRDAKKRHRQDGATALGSYRYYLCEPGVIRVEDLPAKWGLLHVKGRGVELVAGAEPKRHYWPPETDIWRWETGFGEKVLMFSALQRVKFSVGSSAFRELVQQTYSEQQKFKGADHG